MHSGCAFYDRETCRACLRRQRRQRLCKLHCYASMALQIHCASSRNRCHQRSGFANVRSDLPSLFGLGRRWDMSGKHASRHNQSEEGYLCIQWFHYWDAARLFRQYRTLQWHIVSYSTADPKKAPHLTNFNVLGQGGGTHDYMIPRADGSMIIGGARPRC